LRWFINTDLFELATKLYVRTRLQEWLTVTEEDKSVAAAVSAAKAIDATLERGEDECSQELLDWFVKVSWNMAVQSAHDLTRYILLSVTAKALKVRTQS
jgi:hypothetical protein